MTTRRRARAAACWALGLAWCAAAQAVSVSTPQQLLAALAAAAAPGAPRDTVVELATDIALTQADAADYSLPFVIPANHTLEIRSAGKGMRTVSFGEVSSLLFFRPDSTLVLRNLNASGSADPQLGSWPVGVNSSTVIQSMPFWPTIGAEPGFTPRVYDCNLTLHPTDLCTPEVYKLQFGALQQLAVTSGTNMTDLWTNGTVAYFDRWAAPVPVLSAATKVAVGTVLCSAWNMQLHCTLPQSTRGANTAPAPAPALSTDDETPAGNGGVVPSTGSGSNAEVGSSSSSGGGSSSNGDSSSSADSSSSSSGGNGTPGWVWAIVGVAVALAMTASLAVWLRRQRRTRKRLQQQQLVGVKLVDPAELPSEPSQSTTRPGSDMGSGKMGSMGLPSPGTSGFLDRQQSNVPDGAFKSRVGFIDGLQLGALIGRGGYARVYKGRWKGTTVAVKVVETHVGPQQQYDLRDEPLLSLSLSHPNVLQGYKMCAVKLLSDAETEHSNGLGSNGTLRHSGGSHGSGHSIHGSGGRVVPHLTNPNCMVEVMPTDAVLEPGMYEMWLVSELADKGTLADAMAAGWFTSGDNPARNMPVILLCLLDVARGLEYLHSCSIVHGDLKPQNVLLKTAVADQRDFVCKLGDFGLSRILRETETHVDTGSYGTVTHAAPELLTEGRLTKACDVFAFGIMMWELVSGQRLFPDMHHMQIIVQVTQHGYRPHIPAAFPPALADLARRCWAAEPHARPTTATVVRELMAFSATLSTPQQNAPSQHSIRAAAAASSPAAVPATARSPFAS